MKFLLDTHTFLWLVEGSRKLSKKARAVISDPANDLYLSVASIWELAIKTGNKRLTVIDPLDEFIDKWTAAYQLDVIAIAAPHAIAVVQLPDHHRDPFDRILIAQALVEGFTLVSGDAKFSAYQTAIVW